MSDTIPTPYRRVLTEALAKTPVMQIATTTNEQPWICSVYFVIDSQLRWYWLSYDTRRHSQDIAHNPRVALAVAIKTDIPVIGLQAEGRAEKITNLAQAAMVLPKYITKYGQGTHFLKNLSLGKNKHSLYRFTPERLCIFDEAYFGVDTAHIFRV